MESGPAIVVDGLHVRRGHRRVLHDVSFAVPRGQVMGLLGPSGCGKTTLMRSLVGVQIVEAGRVDVLGLPAGSPPLRRRVGYLTQAPSVYADLSVRENLRYFSRVLGARRDRIDEMISAVRLEPQADQVTRDLSGGELARVSLATALLGEPELLVLDEPTVGLDPVLRRDLWELFHRLSRRGATELNEEAGRNMARVGDLVQITKVTLEDDKILLEINNGMKSGRKWYQNVEIGMGTSTAPISGQNSNAPGGTNIVMLFHKSVSGATWRTSRRRSRRCSISKSTAPPNSTWTTCRRR